MEVVGIWTRGLFPQMLLLGRQTCITRTVIRATALLSFSHHVSFLPLLRPWATASAALSSWQVGSGRTRAGCTRAPAGGPKSRKAGDFLIVGASGHDVNALADTGPARDALRSMGVSAGAAHVPGLHTSSPEALAGNRRHREYRNTNSSVCENLLWTGQAGGQRHHGWRPIRRCRGHHRGTSEGPRARLWGSVWQSRKLALWSWRELSFTHALVFTLLRSFQGKKGFHT